MNNRSFEKGVGSRIFIAAFFVIVLVPLVCIPLVGSDVSAEKRELAPVPSLVVDGRPNVNVLQEAGAWFDDHFAFRGLLVDADATLKERVFMTSATENVVVGSDGWLYYAGTLNDWQRRNAMSEHELKNAAHNLALIQEWLHSQGKGFAFCIAPNKNTLYPQSMPYYEMAGDGQSNLERLVPLLASEGVSYVDLRAAFEAQNKILYYARDSHWNGEGALLAYRTIGNALSTALPTYVDEEMQDTTHKGDIDQMLHPQTALGERDSTLPSANAYTIVNEAEGVEDSTIQTTSSSGDAADATLVMYRDSFGNNLLPFFATAYRNATFSKLVPYDMGPAAIRDATDVIVERAERHLNLFATDPPYMPSPIRMLGEATGRVEDGAQGATVHVSTNGPYFVVEGSIDGNRVNDDDPIYVELTFGDARGTVEAFRVSAAQAVDADSEGADDGASDASPVIVGDWGYRAYFYAGNPDATSVRHVRVLAGDASAPLQLADVSMRP